MKPSVNKMQQEAREAVHERRIKELEAKLCKTQQELSVQHNHNAELQSRISELEAGLAQSQREVAALRLISTVPQQDKPPRRPACVPGLCEIVSCSCRDGIVEAGAQEAALPDPATLVLSTSVDWSETIWQPFAVAAYAKAHTALKAIPSLPAGLSLPEMPQLKFDSIEAAKESLLLSAARLERTMSMLPAHISPKPWHAFPSVVTWTISVKVKVSQQVLWAHLSEVRAALLTSVEVMQCLSTDVAEMYSVRNLSDSVETISEQWGILPAPCSRRSAWHACPSVVTWATNLKSRVPRNVEDGRANTALHTLFEDTSIALASIRRDFLAKKKSSDPASPILNAIPPVDISLPPIASIGVPLPHMPALGSWPGVDSQDEGRQNTGSMVQPPTQSSSAERRSGPSPAAVTLDALVDGKEHTIAGLGWENRGAAVLSPVPFQSPSIIADDFTEMSSARTQYEHAGAKTGASAPTALESDDLLSQLAEGLITTEEMRKLASTFTPRTCQAVLEQERCLNAPNTTSRSEDMRPQILEEVSTGQWNNRPGPSGTGSARIVPYSSDTLSSDNDSRPTSARLLAAAAEAGEGIRAFLTAITPREMSAQEKEEAAAAAAARREARQRHKEKQKALELEAAAKKKMLADKKAGEKRRQEEEAKQAALQQAAARKDAQRKAIEAERRRREDAQQRKKAARDRARNHEQDGNKEKATVTKNEHSKVEQSRKSGSAQSKPQEDWEQQRPPACSPEPGAAPARDCARALDDAAQTAQKQAIEAKQRAAEVDDAGAWRETEVSRHDSAVARMAGARRQRIVASAWLAWVDEAAGGLSNECEEKMLPLLLKGSTDGQIRRHFSLVDSNLSCIQVRRFRQEHALKIPAAIRTATAKRMQQEREKRQSAESLNGPLTPPSSTGKALAVPDSIETSPAGEQRSPTVIPFREAVKGQSRQAVTPAPVTAPSSATPSHQKRGLLLSPQPNLFSASPAGGAPAAGWGGGFKSPAEGSLSGSVRMVLRADEESTTSRRHHKDSSARGLAGVGLYLENNTFRIRQMLAGGPAEQSRKIRLGDRLVAVEGKQISRLSIDAVRDMLVGPEGSTVTLLLHSGLRVELVRRAL